MTLLQISEQKSIKKTQNTYDPFGHNYDCPHLAPYPDVDYFEDHPQLGSV